MVIGRLLCTFVGFKFKLLFTLSFIEAHAVLWRKHSIFLIDQINTDSKGKLSIKLSQLLGCRLQVKDKSTINGLLVWFLQRQANGVLRETALVRLVKD